MTLTMNAQNWVDTTAVPKVFAEGIVSTPYSEWATSLTPDQQTVYYSMGGSNWTCCFSKMVDGKWTKPRVANFSGRWRDTDPFVSPDGKRIIFVSNRPLPGMPQDQPQKRYHLWYADNIGDNVWSEPRHIDAPVNIDASSCYGPSIDRAGNIYFCSRDREGNKGMGSYCSKWLGDHYGKPQLLRLNGDHETQDPFISPEGGYVIFVDNGKDLYIARKQGEGWSAAESLGPQVNNGDPNSSPYVSPDGKTLYYSSSRIQGLYHPKERTRAIDYDQLIVELQTVYNSEGNILVIPINLRSTL
jgi:hypothetical protein